ncbi:DUF4189 domain-containing protein [Xanthomonas sp. JAI131]|uniref:DUF4189 domain-containing protein n=1 Tax=Xanthomonas sp. JAI131 TaxID=2723067 RepID=UPI001C549842
MAFAQTACPVGVALGSAQCGPSSILGSEILQPPPSPSGEWIKTWGAIATAPNGDTGVSSKMLSKEDAESKALNNCIGLGSSGCRVSFVYRNQCVAAVNPVDGGDGGVISSAETLDKALKRALSKCRSASGSECKASIAECSAPFFRKY